MSDMPCPRHEIARQIMLTARRQFFLPRLHNAEIIQDFLAEVVILDQETVARGIQDIVTRDLLPDEESCGCSCATGVQDRDADGGELP